MAQVHISEWYPSPRSSTFDPAIHSQPTHPPELDFDPDFDARMRSPPPADATTMPPPLPVTPKRTKKIARIGGFARRPTALILSPRRASSNKMALAEAAGRRARIYNGSSPGRSLSGTTLRVAGSAIASSPERLALLSSASPSRRRIPSPYISPKRKAGGKKLSSSPSAKVSLGLIGSVLGSLKRFRAGGSTKGIGSLTRSLGAAKGGKYVRAASIWEGHDSGMEIDTSIGGSPSNDGVPLAQRSILPTPLSLGTTGSSHKVRPPLAITSAEEALSAELDELLFGSKEPVSPSTAMGYLSLGGSSSTPDVTTATAESEVNPFMTATCYQEAMGSRSADTLPLSTHWDADPLPWPGCASIPSDLAAGLASSPDGSSNGGYEVSPSSSPISISASIRRARNRGKAVRVLGVEARSAAGESGRKGAACASYKEAWHKEHERRSAKGDGSSGKAETGANGMEAGQRAARRPRGRINSN